MKRKLSALLKSIKKITARMAENKTTLYAAQASFFIIISAVPFVSLLVSIIGLILPTDAASLIESFSLPDSVANLLGSLLSDLKSAPNVSLLSISAVTTLWAASKGTTAVRAGLETAYHTQPIKGFIKSKIPALTNTLFFMLLILGLVVLMLFGGILAEFIGIPLLKNLFLILRLPFFFFFMVIVFAAMYSSASKNSEYCEKKLKKHFPGALFAALGWMIFSYGYSLYVTYSPGASKVYGSLAAVCFILLWIYFCVMILLLGAEINKLYRERNKRKNK